MIREFVTQQHGEEEQGPEDGDGDDVKMEDGRWGRKRHATGADY